MIWGLGRERKEVENDAQLEQEDVSITEVVQNT